MTDASEDIKTISLAIMHLGAVWFAHIDTDPEKAAEVKSVIEAAKRLRESFGYAEKDVDYRADMSELFES